MKGFLDDLGYDYIIDSNDKNYFIIKNYCKHGNLKIYRRTANNFYNGGYINNNISMCPLCRKELFDNYIPTEKEIKDFQIIFADFYKTNNNSFNSNWLMFYYPKELKILTVYKEKYFSKYPDLPQRELAYLFTYNLHDKPTCLHENCNNPVYFHANWFKYNTFCGIHMKGYNASGKESELNDFISTLGINYKRNVQNIIGKEFDFYFPDKHIAIEFNGTWFHCDYFKPKTYHQEKYLLAKEKNIQLITVWEDDWNLKTDIIKDLIKSKLGIFDKKIGARETVIKEVPREEVLLFIDSNHLQSNCIYRTALGLYHKDELVFIMTFGKSRFKENYDEILRISSKSGYCIIGGANKILQYYIKNYCKNKEKIISYCNCDISNGDIYNKLGMDYTNTTLNWWWYKNGIRINRLNSLKEDENLEYRCYGSGTMKFELPL